MATDNPYKEIVLATRNQKKLRELRRITEGLGINILTLDDFPDCPEVDETGETFEDNALKKAREVSAFTGRTALSDDSGLEVDALNGAPGVYSARYAGEGATDADNVTKMLHALEGLDSKERTGRFHCVIALVSPDKTEHTFNGKVEGVIGRQRRGDNGFGYDPVFYPEGYTQTFAQMDAAEKDSMSHRGRALEGLIQFLKSK